MRRYAIGMDVGSTTVKAVVVDLREERILWQDYRRHGGKQQDRALEFLKRIEGDLGLKPEDLRLFITGSGGTTIAPLVGARFVQEVNAVSLAVEKFHPDCGSVVELGGQDAKIIIYREERADGRKRKVATMNDKCAGGTGAVIDKIAAKLKIGEDELPHMGYRGFKIHPVAGKCGVFAETDINSLQKLGIPKEELMASLFDAIIQQNLSVLTRGNTLRPVVLLLGGPNTYIKGMQECWRHHIPLIWEERGVELPRGVDPEDLVRVPENSEYFAAIGAVEYGKEEDDVGLYKGWVELEKAIAREKKRWREKGHSRGLVNSQEELSEFRRHYSLPPFEPLPFTKGRTLEGWIGIDGGSTSTKAVLIDEEGNVLWKAYQLSKGNPIEDVKDLLKDLRDRVEGQGVTLRVRGVGTTGYAKDTLKEVLQADVALVETVAHAKSALHYYNEVDVICDVGGQDIKLIFLREGRVVDFKLNTQCSAGNGYFLQATAEAFGYRVEEYADAAFSARRFPEFTYGCAVFLQSDIVNFQRQGWSPEEIMAGLAHVLPKNIWFYVAKIPNLASLGRHFILQGGTQRNLAAVKAQVDFIRERFRGKGTEPVIRVHRHCGECGAIGAALEALEISRSGRQTRFIGLEAVSTITYEARRDETTRCHFCRNRCLRTFIDTTTASGTRRLIVATCEKGTVEDVEEMKAIRRRLERTLEENPNLSDLASKEVFRPQNPPLVADPVPRYLFTPAKKKRAELMKRRGDLVIGIPRVLNMYSLMPWFMAYFQSLGVKAENIVLSHYTSERLYREGAKRGAIDPCFPSKLGIPHIHNLIYRIHPKKRIHVIFFPMIDSIPPALSNTIDSRACPTVQMTPEATEAAFRKEKDLFRELGITFLNTFLNLAEPALAARQMFNDWKDILGLSRGENEKAIREAYRALDRYNRSLKARGREVIERLVEEGRIGIVVLGRPYHNDPGINHGILSELQKLGYPILTQDSLPTDPDILEELFGEDVRRGVIKDPLDISDVWKNSFSENSNRKVWAAKFVARHPNLVALELSSFKCGHDAPIYTLIQEIVEGSGTPYFSFKEIDENKPTGSIKIRVETIDYFLKRYREKVIQKGREGLIGLLNRQASPV